MDRDFAESGIPSIGRMPWGTHFCQFYEEGADLRDTLVPYFRAGLEHDQSCLWVTPEAFGVDDATAALQAAVPGLKDLVKSGQLEIVDSREWYLAETRFDPDRILAAWAAKADTAMAKGFDGLRVAGDTFWVDSPETFSSFNDYERRLNRSMQDRRMVCLCSYCLSRTQASDVLDVVHCHDFALTRREGDWDMVESTSLKIAKERLRRANEELEDRVADRTAHLERALADKEVLLKEVHHRVKNNLQMVTSLLFMKGKELSALGSQQIVDDVVRRIHAIGLVHETLYLKDDSHRIDFSAYLADLAKSLVLSYSMDAQVETRVVSAGGWLGLNEAIPLSLIVTEVVTNALKHAFPDGRRGSIELGFYNLGAEGNLLKIRDSGVGLPARAIPAEAKLGLTLVQKLTTQVGGRATFEASAGTTFTLRFPNLDHAKDRVA
jgi:two-component sensor histidine kinase